MQVTKSKPRPLSERWLSLNRKEGTLNSTIKFRSLMTETKFGQGTRVKTEIRNGDFLAIRVKRKYFFTKQAKHVLIYENN
jgi:hypothetical protein